MSINFMGVRPESWTQEHFVGKPLLRRGAGRMYAVRCVVAASVYTNGHRPSALAPRLGGPHVYHACVD
jgi:hypothetical protein